MSKRLNIASVDQDELERIRIIASEPYGNKSQRAIWLQIYDRLSNACIHGPLSAGSRLPSENDLADLFDVSRVTMRRALTKLQQEGQLQARKGVGIFVRQHPARYAISSNMRFVESLNVDAEQVKTHTLSLARRPASLEAMEALRLKQGAEVICLDRVRMLNDEPVYFTTKEFPADLFPQFEAAYEARQSVADVYQAHGIKDFKRVETRVSGGFAHSYEAEALQLTHRTPLMRTTAINSDTKGKPIEFSLGRWPLASVELIFNEQ